MIQWSLPQICVRMNASDEKTEVQTMPGSVSEPVPEIRRPYERQ